MRSNLSPTEATAQLRVLCRKFAALAEKVKVCQLTIHIATCAPSEPLRLRQEETKLREEAQREVRRLKDIVDGALLSGDRLPLAAGVVC